MQPTKEELLDWDKRHYWHSFTPMADYEPLIIERAEGCTLYDIDNKAYLDAASSMWCNALGHNHQGINQAIQKQLERVAHCTSLGMGADVSVQLAKRLADITPGALEHVFFSSDGSSAIEIAMKLAFQYWHQRPDPRPQKTKFLSFDKAYHGDTIGATAIGGIGRYYEVYGPLLCEVVRTDAPDQRVADCAEHLARLEKVFREHAAELLAVVIEPIVQCAAGMVMQPEGFLAGLRKLCDQHEVLLIADEVAVGFGKTGKLFACEQETITPDFLCIGKGLTAGYLPMAATLTTPTIYQEFLNRSPEEDRTFWHGHTFSGNPLAAAAALACLNELESGVVAGLEPKIAHLGQRLCELASNPLVKNARQRGLIAAFDLDPGGDFLDEATLGRRMARHALEQGVWLRAKPDLVYVMPPLSVTIEEIDRIMDVIAEGLELAY